MAQLTKEEYDIQTAVLFPTNGTGAISATDIRDHFTNTGDSLPFKFTGQTTAPTINDDGANTGGNGASEVGDFWLDETNDIAYVCLDNSTGTAIWPIVASDGDLNVDGNIVYNISIQSEAASYTLALTDQNTIQEIDSNAGAVIITIPTNAAVAFPIGTIIEFTNIDNTSAISLAGDTGVILNGISAGSGTFTGTIYEMVKLYKRGTDAWITNGDIGVVS